ncbi:MAG: hypothetical protein JXQ29_12310 [Planctomycetes bacterium]|nr:hypothetical protein [Planctomycetota bacterium]
MSYEAATIGTNLQGGARRFSAVRAMDGTLYALHWVNNPASGPKRCRLWYSLGDGRPGTWAEETWSQAVGGPSIGRAPYSAAGDGGTDPVLLADPAGHIWLATSSYGGVASPHILRRNAGEEQWGEGQVDYAGFLRLSLSTVGGSFDAVMDQAFPTSGTWNIACVYLVGTPPAKAYYTDVAHGVGDTEIDPAHTNYTACRILVNQAGHKWAFLLDSAGALWVCERDGAGSGAWGARVQINSGTTVASLEDVCLHPCGFPCCLYRVDAGGGVHHLHHAEFSPYTSAWGSQRVWDGANNYSFFAGHSLEYDARGSIFVVGPYDHDGDLDSDDGHIYRWDHIRALDPGVTAWTPMDLTSAGVGGTILQTVALKSRTPFLGGYLPSYLDQGSLVFAYVWATGSTADQQSLVLSNRDYYGTRDSNYPTILSGYLGIPLFRPADDAVRVPATIGLDKTPIGPFPSLRPSVRYSEARIFQTNEARFEAGYTAQVARFTSGQRVISIAFTHERKAALDAVVEYALARQRDGRVFSWLPPDYEGDADDAKIPVRMLPAPIERETVTTAQGDRVQVVAFQMIEVL